jgi:hypothetical protein
VGNDPHEPAPSDRVVGAPHTATAKGAVTGEDGFR